MFPDAPTEVKAFSAIEELQGKLRFTELDDALLHTVLDNDKNLIEEGRVITDSINKGVQAFTPNMLFEQLVKSYRITEELFGEKLLRYLTGYSGDYIARNMNIPEFQRDIKRKLEEGFQRLKDKQLVDEEGWTKKGIELASLMLYMDELDHLVPKGNWGDYVHKKKSHHGVPFEQVKWQKGTRYRDIAVKGTVKTALRRQHNEILVDDLRSHRRENKGKTTIIYAMDASGSMKGGKIEASKKAGIALAFTAINRKDKVGLLVFKDKVVEEVLPTTSFSSLLETLIRIRPGKETDFVSTVKRALALFPKGNETKHLIVLSDAIPTIGKNPETETLQAIADAADQGITISLIGISLEPQGLALAQKIVEVGKGRLYIAKNIEELDRIILEDYSAL